VQDRRRTHTTHDKHLRKNKKEKGKKEKEKEKGKMRKHRPKENTYLVQ
jgi:hypothetical protein